MQAHTSSHGFESLQRIFAPLAAIAVFGASDIISAQTIAPPTDVGVYQIKPYASYGVIPEAKPGGGGTSQPPSEESKSPGVYQIKADYLHNLGYTGLNVTAAIIDTGIMASHPEFAGRVRPGYNAFDGSSNVTDGNGHGTHVSGIVGAAKDETGMFGVAYDAFLLPIKVLNDRGSGTSTSVANGIQYAVSQREFYLGTLDAKYAPFVINLSLGSSSPSETIANALKSAVSAGMVVAAAAGNDGGANPIYPARYAKENWANAQFGSDGTITNGVKGAIIAVGAVDANNVIASWSNRAGDDTKYFYLVAPGVSIYSTYPKLDRKTKQYLPTYATLSGTSMATPYVTGAVALIKSGWSYLDAPTVANILFTSAEDLGATGTDAIYGRGLLNLEAAVAPIGPLSAPTSSGTTVELSGTSLTGSGATSTALQAAGRAGLLQVAAFDSFGRDYQVDLAPTVRRVNSSANGLAAMLATVDAANETVHVRNGSTLRVSYRSEATQVALGRNAPGSDDGGFSVSAVDAAGRELAFGLSGMGTRAFGLAGELARRGDAQLSAAFANPYFALAEQHMHAGMGIPLAEGLRMKLGVLASGSRALTPELAPQLSTRRQNMALAEFSGQVDSAVWSVGFGRLQEGDAVLGTTQTGALNFAGKANTNVANFGVAFPLASRVTLGAQYSVGYTDNVANQAAGLVTGYANLRSTAYAASVSFAEAFRPGDSLGLTVSQPMRAVSGAMQMVVPVGADENGAPVMTSRSISLKPDGRETRADVLYISPINRSAKWFLGVGVRNQPDHDRAAPNEVTVGGGLRAVF